MHMHEFKQTAMHGAILVMLVKMRTMCISSYLERMQHFLAATPLGAKVQAQTPAAPRGDSPRLIAHALTRLTYLALLQIDRTHDTNGERGPDLLVEF